MDYVLYCTDMLTRYEQKHLTWIDLVSPTPAEARSLMEEFNFHPAFAQELLGPSYRSKVEHKGDEIFLILHFPTLRGVSARAEHEIDFIIGKNFLITTRYENTDPLHIFARVFEVEAVLGRGSAAHGGHLFASMAKSLYQALSDESDALAEKLKEIEERIFRGDERQMVAEISFTGRVIHDFRQALLPHKEMLSSLEPVASRLFGPEFSYYLHEIQGVYRRVELGIGHLRESLTEMRETNNSLLSTKQNEIMKTLTIMAFVTFPLTLFTSLFGMETVDVPLTGYPGDFWVIVSIMVAVTFAFFIFFKRKGWL